jgi:hypothetical protein
MSNDFRIFHCQTTVIHRMQMLVISVWPYVLRVSISPRPRFSLLLIVFHLKRAQLLLSGFYLDALNPPTYHRPLGAAIVNGLLCHC